MHRSPTNNTDFVQFVGIRVEFLHWCLDKNTVENSIVLVKVANCCVLHQLHYFAVVLLVFLTLVLFAPVPLVFSINMYKQTTIWMCELVENSIVKPNLKFFCWNLWCSRSIRWVYLTILIVRWKSLCWLCLWAILIHDCWTIIIFEWIVIFEDVRWRRYSYSLLDSWILSAQIKAKKNHSKRHKRDVNNPIWYNSKW